jgi:diacylglycerol kinase family enzyme
MSETKLSKIAISTAADEALSKSLEQINRDFEGGRVTKTELASWYLLNAAESLDAQTTERIQNAHFNQIAYLEALAKKMRSSGRANLDPAELDVLRAALGSGMMKKRNKKTSDGKEQATGAPQER